MVVLRLCGGLGNQFWQRAFGYVLEARGNEVVFDRSYFDTCDSRAYALDHWNTEVTFGPRCGQEITEPDLRYHPELLKKYNEDVTLAGYFQCPVYLEGIEDTLRLTFTLKDKPSKKTLAVAREIENSNSVCLHIRRTDTLSERGIINHGLVPGEYYAKALDYVIEKLGRFPHVFVFSDDMEWCKKHIGSYCHTTFIDHNTTGIEVLPDYEVRRTDSGTEHEDLWLMSLCKHQIIANSSFGWWAAWLNQNPQKICIVPERWFVPGSPHDSTDMIPSTWMKL